MKICVAAPIATADMQGYLHALPAGAPAGYLGAPLTAVLIGELLRQGHQICAVTVDYDMAPGASRVHMQGPGLQFTVIPGRARAWRPNGWAPGRALDLFRTERAELSRIISASGADVVHAHWSYEFALAALASGLPVVVTAHDSPRQVFRHTRTVYRAVRWWMALQVFRKARHVTTVSPYMTNELKALTAVPIDLIPNPVAPYVFAAGRRRAASPQASVVAYVGNGWGDIKNPIPALLGFAKWRGLQANAELHMFGSDFEPQGKAQRWAEANGISGVHFHGLLPHAELIAQLAQTDVLLHTALEESFGVVLAEAMALGLPVVAGRNSGAVPWLLGADAQGQTPCGVLVDVRSPDAVCAGLQQVLDAAYGARSAAGLLAAQRRFSASSVTQAYECAYHRVMHSAAAQPCADLARGRG
jgi:L-malate glycosyltransferase